MRDAARLVQQGQLETGAKPLQAFLTKHPNDVGGLFLVAEIARQKGRLADAASLFARCAELQPDFTAARFRCANTFLDIGRPHAALAQAGELLKRDPENPVFRALKAMALELADDFAGSAALWREVVAVGAPPDCWVRYAHTLRALGQREESIAACRQAITRDPGFGRAWWALATRNTFHFTDADIAEMEKQIARTELAPENRVPLFFALGKAYADRGSYTKSFAAYARGNAQHRFRIQHNPGVLTAYVGRCKALFTNEFFRARKGAGHDSRTPIFLVGMLRSGSTLVEQIVASHSQVEGTRELFGIAPVAQHVQREFTPRLKLPYPEVLGALDPAEFNALGERYLESVRPFRRLERPHLIDKMGNNFTHLGLIHLMLPNAKIVDVRRHPLACGWSNFTQYYANGQNETYRLADFAALYRDYAALMAHFESVLPGRVHRVDYEHLVADPETEIRRLLDYLELPFEESCLAFHENARAVSTVSSEQVRSPLYKEALDHWRHYEPWLGPLKSALGPLADT
ncbi:MAG: sulfotransferase [Rhizomicrobium sp.]